MVVMMSSTLTQSAEETESWRSFGAFSVKDDEKIKLPERGNGLVLPRLSRLWALRVRRVLT